MVKATGAKDMVVEEESITLYIEGTLVRRGEKGIHPTPPNPNTDRGSSAVIRPTVM